MVSYQEINIAKMIPRGTLWFGFFDHCSIYCSSFSFPIPLTFTSCLVYFSRKVRVSEKCHPISEETLEQESNMNFGDVGTVFVWIFCNFRYIN